VCQLELSGSTEHLDERLAGVGVLGCGEVRQGVLEMSNVQVVEEMVEMIVAQRAYEANSKGVQTADDLLRIANGLKR